MDKKFYCHSSVELQLQRRKHRPSWESRNEGVHERVNFDDTLWGFELAGGAYYDTPLRVTYVKEGSRAERAGIKVGDILRSINNVDTSTLTITEAHKIILESGINIKLCVTAPDVEETTYNVYQDELEDEIVQQNRHYTKKQHIQYKVFKGAKTLKKLCLVQQELKAKPDYESSVISVRTNFGVKSGRVIRNVTLFTENLTVTWSPVGTKLSIRKQFEDDK